ncbi:MAG TPA: hypothetical protein VFP66_00575 [Candidatus Limnocylindrales bacterium]|nr:hypothetical protein [Candidatus Limnocylindrales bacterium]
MDRGRFRPRSRPVIRSTQQSRAYQAIVSRAKRQPYSRERRAEALALARIAGAEVASERTGIPIQTIRRWMDAAGVRPGADLPQERLEALRDLAEASVTRDLVEGRIRGVQAMTVAGIARRHIAKAEAATTDGSGSAVAAYDEFAGWLVDAVVTEPIESEEAFAALEAAIDDVVPMLLRRANAETDLATQPPSPHRVALLAWHSGRPEIEAGDVLEWAKSTVLEVIAEHGNITAWHAWQQAEDEAEHARREAEYAAIQARAEALKAEADKARLDAEESARLAAAELSRRPRI